MTKIVIDAGHGGRDLGASYDGRYEKNDNLNLALAVGKVLENDGYDIVYTRDDDVYDSPSQKAAIANQENADFFISFHRNSSEEPGQYEGVQTLVYDDSGIKAELAREINKNLESEGFKNLGVSVRPDLIVLRKTDMPAVLIETGFINNDKDNTLYDENFNSIAQKIASAISDVVSDTSKTVYYVQTGLYKNRENAERLSTQLKNLGYPVITDTYKDFIRVKTGPYGTLAEAAAAERKLRSDGFSTLIIQ